jgi:hypothetical protein
MWVVGQHGADADQDGVAFGAHLVDPGPRHLPGDARGLSSE